MRAAVVSDFSSPLVAEERSVPVPGPGEVRVRIEASVLVVPTSTLPAASGPSSRNHRSFRGMKVSASSTNEHPPHKPLCLIRGTS